MLDKMTQRLDFHGNALQLRAERQRTIASNIANADTPGYVGRDFQFVNALRDANARGGALSLNPPAAMSAGTHEQHVPVPTVALGQLRSEPATHPSLGYSVQSQASLDRNTVDLDQERANFADNAVRYEATLRFLNGQSKTMLAAIQGQ